VFTNAKKGAYGFQGEEAGIIRFGSRVDLILPLEAEIMVKIGDNVRACETIIAKFPQK
jgi:phosphatidylserine decarboxylase